MRTLPAVLGALLAATALAGCGDGGGPGSGREIIVSSAPIQEVSSENKSALRDVDFEGLGHVGGVVVDEAIRPLENATVRIPGLDLTDVSDREGSFAFVDLRPGAYFLTAKLDGFYPAEVEIDIPEDKFVRVRFVLTAIPPPEPWHETLDFEGYAEATSDPVVGGFGFLCTACYFDFYAGTGGFGGMTVEAFTDVEQVQSFWHVLSADGAWYSSGSMANPLHAVVKAPDLPSGDIRYDLSVEPESLAPQTAVGFEVFVTLWHNQEPPAEWSIADGDP